ncbi:MAG: tRNA guanosine(15) transglycosylase TgtA [Candidatus Thorarchaeota archaeon]
MKFEIFDVDVLGRLGLIEVNNKRMVTPNLLPVIHPTSNLISAAELEKFGAECIFTNAFILYQNTELRREVLNKGIHKSLNFNGLIATDSGAFQQYMYNNKKFDLDAETIETFQEEIGSDFPVILDVPVQINDNYETAKSKVIITINRAKDNVKRRARNDCYWFGPIHGGYFQDLLEKSIIEMSKLDFSVYALGGLVKLLLDYRFDLVLKNLLTVKSKSPPNKPIHMFGLGLPQFFSLAVGCGCDLMDSAAYILFAREERYFTLSTGTKHLNELEEFPCHCPICSDYTPKELKECNRDRRIELLARHNLYLSFSELKTIRQSIREGNLWELIEQRVRIHPNLVKALQIIKEYNPFIEKYEKLYKNHGRLYSSSESFNRPLIYRYLNRISNDYRCPEGIKYLLILPELDVKGKNSPTFNHWMDFLDENKQVNRKQIHVVFFSLPYGIIPLELAETFPMGQYESITPLDPSSCRNSLKNTEFFLKKYSKEYIKGALLIPKSYINQFGEVEEFFENFLLKELKELTKSNSGFNISIFNHIEQVIEFFKKDCLK